MTKRPSPRLPLLQPGAPFPAADEAWPAQSPAPGLVAVGGALDVPTLRAAYSAGIFPWFSAGEPILWWSTDPRMVLPVAQFKLSKSLAKTLRRFVRDPACEVRIDSAFAQVIDACARTPRDGQAGTWIVPPMVAAYSAWHRSGRVHSFETWVDARLAGGLYGVAIGRMFFGESMFAWASDASKIALAALVAFCRTHGITLIDCQQNTAHLATLGAHELPRGAFEQHLRSVSDQPDIADWTYDPRMWLQLDALRPAPPGDGA